MGKWDLLAAVSVIAVILVFALPVFQSFEESDLKTFAVLASIAFIAAVFMYLNLVYNARAVYHQGF